MATKDRTTSDRNKSLSENFRRAAGLPERKSNKPTDVTKVSEATLATEPEGGYGGKDGISNSGALSESEAKAQVARDERNAKAAEERVKGAEKGEELGAKSGQGNTTPGGEEAKTGPTAAVAKKAAKKTAAKKKA